MRLDYQILLKSPPPPNVTSWNRPLCFGSPIFDFPLKNPSMARAWVQQSGTLANHRRRNACCVTDAASDTRLWLYVHYRKFPFYSFFRI